MLVVQPIDLPQTLEVFGRFSIDESLPILVSIIEKESKKTFDQTPIAQQDEGVLFFSIVFPFKENQSYSMEIKQGGELLNRSLIFCTPDKLDYKEIKESYQQSETVVEGFITPDS